MSLEDVVKMVGLTNVIKWTKSTSYPLCWTLSKVNSNHIHQLCSMVCLVLTPHSLPLSSVPSALAATSSGKRKREDPREKFDRLRSAAHQKASELQQQKKDLEASLEAKEREINQATEKANVFDDLLKEEDQSERSNNRAADQIEK